MPHAASSCTARAPRRRMLLALAVVAIGGAVRTARAADAAFDLRVENGRVPEGMRVIRVNEGDAVTLRWNSDRPLLLHLHGYDIEWRVQPGSVASVRFVAKLTGRFPIHAHDAGAREGGGARDDSPLVYVDVYPR